MLLRGSRRAFSDDMRVERDWRGLRLREEGGRGAGMALRGGRPARDDGDRIVPGCGAETLRLRW
jgi:hypothetical protein